MEKKRAQIMSRSDMLQCPGKSGSSTRPHAPLLHGGTAILLILIHDAAMPYMQEHWLKGALRCWNAMHASSNATWLQAAKVTLCS